MINIFRFVQLMVLISFIGFFAACVGPSKEDLKKALSDNPDVVFDVIKNNPKAFFDAVKEAEGIARKEMVAEEEGKRKKELEEAFSNPKKPSIEADRAIFGDKSAPVTIVEYSDFQCPYCAKAAQTMNKLLKDYKGKVRLVYKHLPFKPLAEPTSRYFEAIAMESTDKAKKFHDYIYENQKKLYSGGEDFLKEAAKSVGASLSSINKNKDSEKVKARLRADKAEAEKFEFSGTPGFLVNGVPVRGAYPYEHFKDIIDKHLKAKKL